MELLRITEFRLLQPSKADEPISVTELGISTDVRLLQSLKARRAYSSDEITGF